MIPEIIEVLFYLVFPFYKRKKQREGEWFGVVEKKIIKGDFSVAKFPCTVIFKTDDGEKIKMKFRQEDCSRYEEGRRYQKRSGEDYPYPAPQDYPVIR
jgi:hypothetical protein